MLKDILLVGASIAIWGTEISGLQMFGYAIALGGLMYYKLGADKLKDYYGQGSRAWQDYSSRNPIMRKLIIFGGAILFIFLILGGLAPRDPKSYKQGTLLLGGLFGSSSQAN